jgi:nucleoside-triphosphatase
MTIKGRVAITGRPGVGKTTLIERVLALVPATVGGFLTKEVRKCGHRVGFSLVDLATGEECLFARAQAAGDTQVGRYAVDVGAIERVGVPAILRAIETRDLVVIDEIAPMELRAPGFAAAVEKALACDKALLIATHAHATHPVADRARQELHLVRVRLGNRDSLVETVAALLRGEIPPGPTASMPSSP